MLSSKSFLLLCVGQIISLFGNAAIRFLLPLWLLEATGSPSLFGLVTGIALLPSIALSTFRHADKNYGTWWEVSAHPYCTNPVRDAGCTLQALIDSDPEAMLGKGITMHEMLRVAFLDAKDALSILPSRFNHLN
ncbi:hypothetical protein [uncultured Dubosiella sp.]|uniref:hypothetical protein n=1 Tax=uncultured Dubosiella sp. TaxID=1937011 RepID=UPI00272D3F93|nr:hypothetical protein [uncultured Dubosiella sp.]